MERLVEATPTLLDSDFIASVALPIIYLVLKERSLRVSHKGVAILLNRRDNLVTARISKVLVHESCHNVAFVVEPPLSLVALTQRAPQKRLHQGLNLLDVQWCHESLWKLQFNHIATAAGLRVPFEKAERLD